MSAPAAPSPTELISGDELYAMIHAERFELVDGRIVPMSPVGDAHGGYELAIGVALREFVKARQIGKVRVGEVGIYIRRDPDTVRAANALYISNERYAQKRSQSYLDVAPELVVEIMSPNDGWSDVYLKLQDYFSIDVRLVWIIDPATRTVHAHRSVSDVRVFAANDTLPGDEVLPGFGIQVAQIFED